MITPTILGILVLVIIPFFIQDVFSQEELSILQNGIVSTASKDYPISNNFEIRVFHDGELIRIKGLTASGHPYYAYQKIVDGNVEIRGKIFMDGKVVPIVKKAVLSQKEEKSEPVTELLILIKQPLSAYYTESYNIITKVFDASVNPLKQFEFNSGLIEGVNIEIILTDPQGKVFRTFDGKTNSMGYLDKRFEWKYADPIGKYNVTVVADDGITKISKQVETEYKGYHPYYSGSDNP